MNLNNIDDLYKVNFCRSGELEWRVKGEARKNSQVYQGPFNRHVHAAECDSLPDSSVVRIAKDEIGSGFAYPITYF